MSANAATGHSPEYVEQYRTLVDSLPGADLPWLQGVRQEALQRFSVSGFPSPREEEWRYTNVTPIERKLFRPVMQPAEPERTALADFLLEDAWQLVLVDGHYSESLSRLPAAEKGLTVMNMAAALQSHGDVIQQYLGATGHGKQAQNHGFLDFSLAGFTDGTLLMLDAGVRLEKPLQILHYGNAADSLANTRHLLVLGANSEARVVETFAGNGGSAYLNASVTEAILADNARLSMVKLQAESERAYHFSGVYVQEAQSAVFRHDNFAFGALLSRNEIHSRVGKGAECVLNGLFMGRKKQHTDNHTRILHAEPHGLSRQLYKGIMDQGARGVFQGMVLVAKDAQQISSDMSNRNLLLSDMAEVDTKPQLEIHADDVKCSHGVTVGQLAPESIFYLQSRGMDREEARTMLTFAFANEMVERIDDDALKAMVQAALLASFTKSGIRQEWL